MGYLLKKDFRNRVGVVGAFTEDSTSRWKLGLVERMREQEGIHMYLLKRGSSWMGDYINVVKSRRVGGGI